MQFRRPSHTRRHSACAVQSIRLQSYELTTKIRGGAAPCTTSRPALHRVHVLHIATRCDDGVNELYIYISRVVC